MIKKIGNEWCVFDKAGVKKLGCHPTEEKAKEQLAAIEASKHMSYAQRMDGIEIFASGRHNGDDYSDDDLDAMVEAFGALDFKPPLKAGHVKDKPGMPALGWVDNLRREGSKLVADFIDMPDLVYEAIKDKLYNTVSSEIYWDFERAGKKFKRALKAVALLGADIPAVANLRPLHEMLHDDAAEVHYGDELEYKLADRGSLLDFINAHGHEFSEEADLEALLDGVKKAAAKRHDLNHSKETDMDPDEIKKLVGDTVAAALAPITEAIGGLKNNSTDDTSLDITKLSSDEKAMEIVKLSNALKAADKARREAADALKTAQTQSGQNAERIKTLEEETRKVKIEKLVEQCRIPAMRSFVRQYADLATRDADIHVYDAQGNKKPALEELERTIGYINANAQRLFTVVSTDDPNNKNEAVPSEEVDRRIKHYKAQHPGVSHHDALHAVLDADPVLKADYAQAG
jgi:hypothetical protein